MIGQRQPKLLWFGILLGLPIGVVLWLLWTVL